VSIDGQDVLKVTGESVRENVAVVLQDGALFDESLMYNIQYGKEGCTEQVKHLDTPVSPRAARILLETRHSLSPRDGLTYINLHP
jgi:ABC-type phosphate transport system ATPase subunit